MYNQSFDHCKFYRLKARNIHFANLQVSESISLSNLCVCVCVWRVPAWNILWAIAYLGKSIASTREWQTCRFLLYRTNISCLLKPSVKVGWFLSLHVTWYHFGSLNVVGFYSFVSGLSSRIYLGVNVYVCVCVCVCILPSLKNISSYFCFTIATVY